MENKEFQKKENLIKKIDLEIEKLQKDKISIEEDYQKLIEENRLLKVKKVVFK